MKTTLYLLCLFTFISLFCGCLTVYETAQEVTMASTVEHNKYDKYKLIKGPEVRYGHDFNECFLRTFISENGQQINQLYVMYGANDWAFLDRARDRQGRSLEVNIIDRSVTPSANISEHIAVQLSSSYLEQARQAGIDIQIAGDAGRTIVKLPPHYVDGFLKKVEKVS